MSREWERRIREAEVGGGSQLQKTQNFTGSQCLRFVLCLCNIVSLSLCPGAECFRGKLTKAESREQSLGIMYV